MAILAARRATDRDLDAIARLCAEAASHRAGLWSARRPQLDPSAAHAAHVPLVVVTEGPAVVGFAAAPTEGVPLGIPKCAEALVYVTPSHRRRGAARAAMGELISAGRVMGLWKVIACALPADAGARKLLGNLDFREVGTLVKHAQLDGGWHDVVLYERLVLAARKSMPSFSDT